MIQIKKKEPNIDYSTLGLKCGLEIHQQLNTERKLFCNCKAALSKEEPTTHIIRYMRPTLSELGEYDSAALLEFKKRKEIVYEVTPSTCLYEIDETPPLEPNTEAIDVALIIAKMLQMDILDELHVNRKQYLDGSVPSGFQRTIAIGFNGQIKVANKIINLDMIALEEDSCREVENTGKKIIWRIDRLGIPLIEITTKTMDISEVNEIMEIAQAIGRILRATDNVKRGLGTIRQDINISIKKGSRVEIKGVQILEMLTNYVVLEVDRQLALLKIKDELERRNLVPEKIKEDYVDCKQVFEKTSCKFIENSIRTNQSILGIKLQGMSGLLGKKIQANRSFGKEIADRVKTITGLSGIIHTDELPNYGITKNEVAALKELFACQDNDAIIFIIGEKQDAINALYEVVVRVKEAFDGVPQETRQALDDGTTSFRRYLGGAGRLYPDTDSSPIKITKHRMKKLIESLPELPDKRKERYQKVHGLPEEIATNLAVSPHAALFDELVQMKVDPVLIAITLEQTWKALMRNNIPVNNISDKKIKEIFELLENKKIAKEAIESLLIYFAEAPQNKTENALKELNLETLTEKELSDIIGEVININMESIKKEGKRVEGKLMGQIMGIVCGKIDGKVVNENLIKQLEGKLKELNII